MISNEQRAHDLAILTLNHLLSNKKDLNSYLKATSDNGSILDITEAYFDLYNKWLAEINSKFQK